MIEIGRVCKKLAGRDGNNYCIIVDVLDDKYVLIDGNVRRKKCNVSHLVETKDKTDIKKGADTNAVLKALEKLGVKILKRTAPRKKKQEKPARVRRKKEKPKKAKQEKKPTEKKAEKTEKTETTDKT